MESREQKILRLKRDLIMDTLSSSDGVEEEEKENIAIEEVIKKNLGFSTAL